MSLLKSVKRAHKNPPRPVLDQERQAIDYARWLAARDGVALSGDGRVEWSHVTIDGKRAKRARVVHFGAQSVWIPNWDFVPTCEETNENDIYL